jgi:UDP-N-acetylglucosamine--N-acetylmuramyl-(pentapeptide) pyrophosphoryl-undecaprenol N-acetylglucosamine transferase
MKLERVIISGGGTGGHIFPAIAIANEIKKRNPGADILFVGAVGKMEMERVPLAGFNIVGLPIAGLQRRLTVKNLSLPYKLLKSLWKAKSVVKNFNPQVVIGVGGYASGPTLKMAQRLKIPTVIQEQNSYPGKTNRLLAKNVSAVCTAYEGLETVFPAERIHFTGNPVRAELAENRLSREEAFSLFTELEPNKKTILIMGGSLGARTLNQSLLAGLEALQQENIQVLWQCGKYYFEEMKTELASKNASGIILTDFIGRMDAAYALADVVISRAGALSISELCLVGKPAVLVPSPNVSEDHQTKNAMALVKNQAAILVKDSEAENTLIERTIKLLANDAEMSILSIAIQAMGKPRATEDIVDVIETVANK